MRAIWSILLVSLFSGPFLGVHFLLPIVQKAHHKKIQVELSRGHLDDDLVILTFTQIQFQALEWEHAREFKLDGKMYDVRSIEKKGQMVLVWCWEDTHESKLNKLSKKIKDQDQHKIPVEKDKSQMQSRQNLVTLYPPGGDENIQFLYKYRPKNWFQVHALMSMLLQKPPTPPPDVISRIS